MKFWFVLMLLFVSTAKADFIFLPESRNQQFRTFGLFIDEQSSVLIRNAGKAWGSLGGAIALAELSEHELKPQLVMHGSANTGFSINKAADTLLTETIDARIGLSVDLNFNPEFRGMVMWTHQSGHISDNVPDADLIGPNLGNEIITLRVLRDINTRWRLGGALRLTVSSDPGMQGLGGEQFVEYFPHEFSEDSHKLNPFIALSTEEYGRSRVELTFHAQVGFAAGNHFLPRKISSMRFVLGYYNGTDPRLKYFQFKRARSEFGYAGVMFEI